jgi:hypothetical protein
VRRGLWSQAGRLLSQAGRLFSLEPARRPALVQEMPAAPAAVAHQAARGAQLVFIDPSIPDFRALLAGIVPGEQVVVLDPGRDGVAQMAEALAGRHDVAAVSVLSHGGPGEVQLGSATLNLANVESYGAQWQAIRSALAPGADLMIYGCDVAAGAQGAALVNRLSALTGANVAASVNLTGVAALGGDWLLEARTGPIEAQAPLSAAAEASYAGVLVQHWTTTGSMSTARVAATATLLGNGKVLVAGGAGSPGSRTSEELYDPASCTWSPTGSMSTPRYYATATLLGNGKVLVAGGYNYVSGTSLASAELYDPASGTWSPTGSMSAARDDATVKTAGPGTSAGLVARYSGTGDGNQYLGLLVNSGGTALARIWSNVGGTWALLASQTLTGFDLSATHVLRFDVVRSSLNLFVDGTLRASAKDSALTSGRVGIRATVGATLDDFSVS